MPQVAPFQRILSPGSALSSPPPQSPFMSILAADRFPSVPVDYDTSLDVGLSAYPPYVSGSPALSEPPYPVSAAPVLASSSVAASSAPPQSPPSSFQSPSSLPFLICKVFAFKAVNDFFTHLGTTIARLKRSIIRAMSYCASTVPPPSVLNVEDMFRPDMFASGSVPLPLSDRRLDAAAIISRHVAACPSCAFRGSLQRDCYMSTMIRCLTHGWVTGGLRRSTCPWPAPSSGLLNGETICPRPSFLASSPRSSTPSPQPAPSTPLLRCFAPSRRSSSIP